MKKNSYSHVITPASFTAILGIAATYFALARIGLLLATPPGYTSALGPAAGLALAAVLLRGYRVLFGVWLGSFAAGLWTALNAGNAILSVPTVLAAVIASGAALQTLLGASLILRFVGCPLNLYRLRDVVKFLLLGGPLSCLVGATVSVSCLWVTGAISIHDLWFNWFTWWVGDATGAMLLSPVVLSLSVKHGEIWKLRRSSVALPLCLLVFVIVYLYVFVSHKEQQRIENEFKLKAGIIASQIKEEWDAHLDALYSEVGFLAAYGHVDRFKFRQFARSWLTRHQSILAMEWIPKVLHAERSGYEEAARRDGYPDFRITEKAQQGQLVERGPQSEYFPVYYLEPYEGNEIALGFDPSSDEGRMGAMNRALMTGKPVGTGRITLVQQKAGQYGFLVFMPVYGRKTSSPGEHELREALKGFALGVFRIEDAMRVVAGLAEPQGIRIQLTDLTDAQGKQLLYDSMPAARAGDDSQIISRSVTSVAPWLATTLEIAERRWQLSFSPTAEYLAEHRSVQAWSVLAGGLIFAAGACAFLLVMSGRTARVEVLVSERTTTLEMEIAERRQAEKALQESETRYRLLADNAMDVIWTVDMDMRMAYISPSVSRLLGFTVEEAMSRTMREAYTPESFEKAVHVFVEEMANESAGQSDPTRSRMLELELVRKDGNTVTVEANFCLLRDATGKAIGFLAIARDITERKQAEDELRRSQRQLADIIDFIPDGTFVINNEGAVIAWNRAMEEMSGIPKSKMIGKGDFEYSLPFFGYRRPILIDLLFASEEKKSEYYDSVSTVRGAIVAETYAPQTYGGKGAYLWGVATGLFDEQGNVTGAIESIRDITERKLAEIALRESDERFSRFFRASPVGTCISRLSDGQFVDANDAFLGLLGYTREEVIGKNALELRIWANPQNRANLLKILKEHGRIRDFETQFVKKSGEVIDLIGFAELIEIAGEQYLLSLAYDITERKRGEDARRRLEEQLFQAQKMESVGRLAGGVAHDFNNMLGVIIGRAEIAMQQDVPHDKLQHHLDEILKAALRSADLTRQLLAFARKQTAEPKILDLNDTISGMLKMLRRLIGEDIDLSWQPGLDLWKVKIDPSQVDQILANLAVNARDAISGVGAVTMRSENVVIDDSNRAEIPESVPGEYVLLAMSDTGAGMSQEVREKIFEPFFTTKELGKGTGLGLSTVYGIVKQNDGFISVVSEPGKGTTFKIYLPRCEVRAAEVPAEHAAVKRPTGTETILLVEDDEAVLALSKAMLEKLGYTVLAAHTHVHAMHLVKEHPGDIHLLITDVVMPEMNGRELAEQLRVIRPNLKCLYMSGYTADAIAHRGLLDEGLNFIQKPFDIDRLATKVKQVLNHLE